MATQHYISITEIGTDAVSLAIFGEIDAASGAEISDHIGPLVAAHSSINLDLSGVVFIDSEGAKPILAAARECDADGGRLTITAWSQPARRLCDVLIALMNQARLETQGS